MWFYKIYFWFYAALTIYVMATISLTPYFFLLTGSAAVGLYLYAYDHQWLPRSFWKIVTIIDLLGQLVFLFRSSNFVEGLLTLLILSPVYIALFRYSFLEKTNT
jgi:hypothetical protein